MKTILHLTQMWNSEKDLPLVMLLDSLQLCLTTGLLLGLSSWCHDDLIKWKHFPRNWPFVQGNSPVTGEFPAQRPVTWSFDVFFDLHLNKRLSKQWCGWWFETPLCPVWRNCKPCYVAKLLSVIYRLGTHKWHRINQWLGTYSASLYKAIPKSLIKL